MAHSLAWRESWKPPVIMHGVPTRWGWTVLHPENLCMGNYVDIGYYTLINAENGVILEEDVEIGPHCAILSASTIDNKFGPIHVKRGAKIGAFSFLAPSVSIGDNAIVGAYSFVKSNIPEKALAFGVPAKIIKFL